MEIKDKEQFLEWFAEVTKQDRATHSQQLGNIYDNMNGYGRIYKFLKKDIGFVVAVGTFLISILSPYFLIKNEISLMNLNITNIKEDVKDVKSNMVSITSSEHELDSRISNLEGRLENKKLK